MEDIKLLRNDFIHFMELNELKHDNIINKLEELNNKVVEKYNGYEKKIVKLENGYDSFKEWRIYTIALITFIGIIIPYVLSKLFS